MSTRDVDDVIALARRRAGSMEGGEVSEFYSELCAQFDAMYDESIGSPIEYEPAEGESDGGNG